MELLRGSTGKEGIATGKQVTSDRSYCEGDAGADGMGMVDD